MIGEAELEFRFYLAAELDWSAVFSTVDRVVKMLLKLVPIAVAPMMIITEINPASRPYSIAAAPSSSRRNCWIVLFMLTPVREKSTTRWSASIKGRCGIKTPGMGETLA